MNKPALRNIERLGNSAESMFNAYYWLCRQMQQHWKGTTGNKVFTLKWLSATFVGFN